MMKGGTNLPSHNVSSLWKGEIISLQDMLGQKGVDGPKSLRAPGAEGGL